MKAFRDSLRALAQIGATTAEMNDAPALNVWRMAASNSVFMLFLGLESARLSVEDLIEFEPEQAEARIVILLSELEALRFLRGKYFKRNDIYDRRIELRVREYTRVYFEVKQLVEDKHSFNKDKWNPSYVLLHELGRRYEAAIPAFQRTGQQVQGDAASA